MATLLLYSASTVQTLFSLYILYTGVTVNNIILAGCSLTLAAALCGSATLVGKARAKFAHCVSLGYMIMFLGLIYCLFGGKSSTYLYSLTVGVFALFAATFAVSLTEEVKSTHSRL